MRSRNWNPSPPLWRKPRHHHYLLRSQTNRVDWKWYIKTRGGTVRPSPVPLPPPPKPDKPGAARLRSESIVCAIGSSQVRKCPSGSIAPTSEPAVAKQPRRRKTLRSHIAGESESRGESEAEPKPSSGLGKRAIFAALLLAACGVVAAPQAPWHPQVKALGARGQHALHVWLNPQPVTTAQAPESHESFNRAGDEYKMPVTENIPDATTDPSQIQVVPVIDPTAKKPSTAGTNADQPSGQPDGATPTDQPASTPSVQAQPPQVQDGKPTPADSSLCRSPTQHPQPQRRRFPPRLLSMHRVPYQLSWLHLLWLLRSRRLRLRNLTPCQLRFTCPRACNRKWLP